MLLLSRVTKHTFIYSLFHFVDFTIQCLQRLFNACIELVSLFIRERSVAICRVGEIVIFGTFHGLQHPFEVSVQIL